jgi:transketolase
MTAGHRHLGGLTAIVDRNRLQQGARTEDTNALEPLSDKWRSNKWEVLEVDGHDHAQLYEAMTRVNTSQPRCIIANTIKGKGVSFIEDRVEWHHKVPTLEQFEQAREELRA